jgi:hypothetical protein
MEVVPEDYDRPETRSECRGDTRPCPWVSCRHHLYLDVNPETGSIKINFPDIEPWDMPETCSLDIAERGGITLEEVGVIMNLTRERIRQVEVRGLLKLRMASPSPEEIGKALLHRPHDRRLDGRKNKSLDICPDSDYHGGHESNAVGQDEPEAWDPDGPGSDHDDPLPGAGDA